MNDFIKEIIVAVAGTVLGGAALAIGKRMINFTQRKIREELKIIPSNESRKFDFYFFMIAGIVSLITSLIYPFSESVLGMVARISLFTSCVFSLGISVLQFSYFYNRVKMFEQIENDKPDDSTKCPDEE